MLTFGSLFAGIGGFDLGLERAGLQCKWQVEIDPYCQRVLGKNWPSVRRWDDIQTFPPPGDWRVDCVVGGFPCQDISYAGNGAGLDGERSSLFYEAMRVVRELEPRIIILENVAALLTRGLPDVLGTLASLGFDAEWHCIPAAAFGAPHIRDRVFILAYAQSDILWANARGARKGDKGSRQETQSGRICQRLRDADNGRFTNTSEEIFRDVANSSFDRWRQGDQNRTGCGEGNSEGTEHRFRGGGGWWDVEPDVGRVANGISKRVDRLRGLGNAVVPQIAEWIGRCIMKVEDLNNACNLVYERTGLVPEVDSAEELVGALLEWGDSLALENEQLRNRLEDQIRESATKTE